jgi:hypothetical protein
MQCIAPVRSTSIIAFQSSGRQCQQAAEDNDACVVDENVRAAERAANIIDDARNAGAVGHIHCPCASRFPDIVCTGARRYFIPIRHGHRRAFLREPASGRRADSGCGPGDQRNFAC